MFYTRLMAAGRGEEREEREGGEGGEGGEEKGSALRPDNSNSHATNNIPNGSIRKKVS